MFPPTIKNTVDKTRNHLKLHLLIVRPIIIVVIVDLCFYFEKIFTFELNFMTKGKLMQTNNEKIWRHAVVTAYNIILFPIKQ